MKLPTITRQAVLRATLVACEVLFWGVVILLALNCVCYA